MLVQRKALCGSTMRPPSTLAHATAAIAQCIAIVAVSHQPKEVVVAVGE